MATLRTALHAGSVACNRRAILRRTCTGACTGTGALPRTTGLVHSHPPGKPATAGNIQTHTRRFVTACSLERGRRVYKTVTVIDLAGLGRAHVSKLMLQRFKKMSGIFSDMRHVVRCKFVTMR